MDFKIALTQYNELEIYEDASNALEGELTSSVMIPLGKWWQAPSFGNALAAKPRQKNLANMPTLLRQSLTNATAWLIRLNKVSQIDITVAAGTKPAGLRGSDRINYKIIAYKNSQAITLDRFYDVSGGTL